MADTRYDSRAGHTLRLHGARDEIINSLREEKDGP